MINEYVQKLGDTPYVAARVLVGGMFAMHGAQKFGYLGGPGVSGFAGFFSLPLPLAYAAAAIELLGGIFILLGLFTRISAILGSVVMITALALAHFPKGLMPLSNGAETPLLYLSAFFIFMMMGAKKLSLEEMIFGKERY